MKQQPRWWVVIGALVVGWGLVCFGPRAAEGQQVGIAADSVVLRKVVEFRLSNNYDAMLCVAAHWAGDTLVLDSLLGPPLESPPCPEATRALLGNADPDLPRDVIVFIGRQILAEYPTFFGTCGVTGTQPQEVDGRVRVAPVMTCAFRKDS